MASQPAADTRHHVYLLRSLAEPKQTYIGLTDDMRARLKSHNEGAKPFLRAAPPRLCGSHLLSSLLPTHAAARPASP
jgi:hypothetical protein